MIKRLLAVLTLNIGILQGLAATTLPGDDTLITNPEGQTEVYCEAFRSIDAANNLPWIYGKKMTSSGVITQRYTSVDPYAIDLFRMTTI